MGTEIALLGIIAQGAFWLGGALLVLPIVSNVELSRGMI